jgi:AbrB family looped-hinge helix DNA binding protein
VRTVLLENGTVKIPHAVRKRLRLLPGEKLEIFVNEEEEIVLRRVVTRPNSNLVDHLLACPFPFTIPDDRT